MRLPYEADDVGWYTHILVSVLIVDMMRVFDATVVIIIIVVIQKATTSTALSLV